MFTKLAITVLITSLVSAQIARLDTTGLSSELRFAAFDSFGDELKGVTLELRNRQGDKWSLEVSADQRISVPYGTYSLVAELSGFHLCRDTIEVELPRQLVFVTLILAEIEDIGQKNTVRGQVTGIANRTGCPWIRFAPLYADVRARTVGLTDAGYFVVERTDPGRYRAIVFGPERLCGETDINIGLYGAGIGTIEVDLSR